MKKSFILLAFALGSVIAFNACVREVMEDDSNSNDAPEVQLAEITINAEEKAAELKSYLDNGAPKWKNGDQVGVFLGTIAANSTSYGTLANSGNDGEAASFTGTTSAADGNYTAYAFYPARAFYSAPAAGTVALEIPEIQFPTSTSFDPNADVMVAKPVDITISGGSSGAVTSQFRRLGTILKVKVTDNTGTLTGDKIQSVTITASAGNLSGFVKYDYGSADDADSFDVIEGKKYVTADYTPSGINLSDPVYIVTPAGSIPQGGTLTFSVKTDKHWATKEVTLGRDFNLLTSALINVDLTIDNTATIERVYFWDNFDWIPKYIKSRDKYGDSVSAGANKTSPRYDSTSDFDPVIKGTVFNSRGYSVYGATNIVYLNKNYLKFSRTSDVSGLQFSLSNAGENNPFYADLSFNYSTYANDVVDLVVEIINGPGFIVSTGGTVSSTLPDYSYSNKKWKSYSIKLGGLTTSTTISVHPNHPSEEGVARRWFIDNLKLSETEPEPATFPVKWTFPDPGTDWVEDRDYHLQEKSFTGTFIYSDDYQGKVTVHSTAKGNGSNNPTYLIKDDVDNNTSNERMLLHYAMGNTSYWEFEVFNVKNSAGTYNIQYSMCSSDNGPRTFRLEYTLDDNWDNPTEIDATLTTPFDHSTNPTTVYYTYATTPTNTTVRVNNSFHLGAMNSFKTLKIRAQVVSRMRCTETSSTSDLAVNVGGTNRLYGTPTISFTAD